MNANDFGEIVRKLRKQENLSQSQLATKINISRNYLSEIERGEAANLSWDIRTKLCVALGISIDDSVLVLPSSLVDFANAEKLPDEDIKMLARLEYRGKQPDTPKKWKILYGVIKMTVESSEK
jgi:transcriptional regulator with XRE-family HTH domain